MIILSPRICKCCNGEGDARTPTRSPYNKETQSLRNQNKRDLLNHEENSGFLFNNNIFKLNICKGCLFLGTQIKLEIQIKVGNMRKLTSSKIKPYISSKNSPKKHIM